MKRNYWLLIFLTAGFGCQKSEPIEIQSILGEFYSIPDSDDYSHLELREDQTYHFGQAVNHSCDIWGHYYGNWEIKEDELVLYEGVDLDSIIEVRSSENFRVDTLNVVFSNDFLKEFPDLKVRIGLSSKDMVIEDQQIVFDKYAYCDGENLFRSSKDKEATYKYYPLELNIRAGKYYYIDQYILNKDTIHIDVGEFENAKLEKKKLLEYRLENGVLKSTYWSSRINGHRLRKK